METPLRSRRRHYPEPGVRGVPLREGEGANASRDRPAVAPSARWRPYFVNIMTALLLSLLK
jgi:hypothetical protein